MSWQDPITALCFLKSQNGSLTCSFSYDIQNISFDIQSHTGVVGEMFVTFILNEKVGLINMDKSNTVASPLSRVYSRMTSLLGVL